MLCNSFCCLDRVDLVFVELVLRKLFSLYFIMLLLLLRWLFGFVDVPQEPNSPPANFCCHSVQHFFINSLLRAPLLRRNEPYESRVRSHSGKSLISLSWETRGSDSNVCDWNRDFKSNLVSKECGEWNRELIEKSVSSCWLLFSELFSSSKYGGI